MNIQILKKAEVSFTVTCYNYVLKLSKQVPIIIHNEQTNHLPILHANKSIYSTVESLAIILCVTI